MKGYTLADRERIYKDAPDDADYWYDMDLITTRECPKCKMLIISHPDCTEGCSNDACDYESR